MSTSITRSIGHFSACRRGTAAVEMAIVGPVFILLTLGILIFGIYFGAAHSVQELAAGTARATVGGLDDKEREILARDYLAATANQYPLINTQKLSMVAAPDLSSPRDFTVTLSYDASHLPIWTLGNLVSLPDKNISRTSVVRRGGTQ